MMDKMNEGLVDNMEGQVKASIDYKYGETLLKLWITDLRPVAEQVGTVADIHWISHEDLLTETWGGEALSNNEIHSMSQIIKSTKTTLITIIPRLVNLFIIQL